MDIIITRGFGASVDTMLVDARTGEVTWSGSKRSPDGMQ